jgi:hypothetical protein
MLQRAFQMEIVYGKHCCLLILYILSIIVIEIIMETSIWNELGVLFITNIRLTIINEQKKSEKKIKVPRCRSNSKFQ